MYLLMYKYGLRIGAVSKLKVNDLMPNGIIIFREKKKHIIKRALIKETFDILNIMIRELELDEEKYMFYYFKFEDDEDKRCVFFFPQNLRNFLHESKSFNFSIIESLSSHIFRATHAINTYKEKILKMQEQN